MKIYGQLEYAQLQNLASDPSNSPVGRIYFNTTDAKVVVHDGTAYVQLVDVSSAQTLTNKKITTGLHFEPDAGVVPPVSATYSNLHLDSTSGKLTLTKYPNRAVPVLFEGGAGTTNLVGNSNGEAGTVGWTVSASGAAVISSPSTLLPLPRPTRIQITLTAVDAYAEYTVAVPTSHATAGKVEVSFAYSISNGPVEMTVRDSDSTVHLTANLGTSEYSVYRDYLTVAPGRSLILKFRRTGGSNNTIRINDLFMGHSAVASHRGEATGVHGVTGTLVGTTDTQTLTNKTISAADNVISGLTAETVAVADASGNLTSSAVLASELDHLSGATSPIQGQLNALDGNQTAHEAVEGAHLPSQTGQAGRVLSTDGSTLSWEAVAAGGGGINLVANPNGVDDTAGWSTSSGGVVVGRNTATSNIPLYPHRTTSLSFLNQGVGSGYAYILVDIPAALRNTVLELSWYQKTGGSYASGDFKVELYAGATKLPLRDADSSGDLLIPASTGKFRTSFSPDGNSQVAVRIVRVAGSASTGIFASEVTVGPGAGIATAPNISPWFDVSATIGNPTGGGSLAGIWQHYRWRRNDEMMQIRCFWSTTVAGSGSAPVAFPLPTISGVTYGAWTPGGASAGGLGYTRRVEAAGQLHPGIFVYAGGNAFYVRNIGAESNVYHTGAEFPSNSYVEVYEFSVPVNEWAGGSNVYLGSNDVEYAYNSSTSTTATDSTSFAYGPAGAAIGAITAALDRRVRFQTPLQTTDQITVEVDADGTGHFLPLSGYVYGSNGEGISTRVRQIDTYYGIGLQYISSTDVDVCFGQYAAPGSASYGGAGRAWSGLPNARWRLVKHKAGSPVGFGMASEGNAGLIDYYRTATVTLAGDFASGATGTVTVTRIGNLVTVSATTMTHNSNGGPTSAGAIPSWARPSDTRRNIFTDGTSSFIGQIEVNSSGDFILRYYSAMGATVARTGTTVGGSLTYTV